MTKKTSLYEEHVKSGAKFISFAGWMMPLHYGSQIKEHLEVRQNVGVFDVSHMTIIDLLGTGCRAFLRLLLTIDIDKLKVGQAGYALLLNHHAGIIDDLIVYYFGPDRFRLIFNASTHDTILAWLSRYAHDMAVGIQERVDLAMIAIQGPKAKEKLLPLLSSSAMDTTSTLGMFESTEVENWFIARTGYTGEDGYEVILPHQDMKVLWQKLIHAGVQPCGLGARDSLRIEAGLLLHGQDMNEEVSPLECGLDRFVDWEPSLREFVGKGALEIQKRLGIKKKMVGLLLLDKGILRSHQKIITDNNLEGYVTSGTFSPILNASIGFGRVPSGEAQGLVKIEMRDKLIRAKIVEPRFIKRGKILINIGEN